MNKGLADVRLFLLFAKQAVSEKKRIFLKRNIDCLGELGLTSIEDAWREVLTLTPSHYFRGPCPDVTRSEGTMVWEFKKNVNGTLIYIKLKFDERGCVCMSFHKDNSDCIEKEGP